MATCNTLNVKLSSSQRNKSKSVIKKVTEVTLNLATNLIGNSNDEAKFSTQVVVSCYTRFEDSLSFCKWFIS